MQTSKTSHLVASQEAAGQSRRDRYRQTLSRFPTGVTVITGRHPAGAVHGMTANAFMSVSLDPPLVAVAVARGAKLEEALIASKAFGVAVLSSKQEPDARRFARMKVGAHEDPPQFDDIEGIPVLRPSLAWLACRVSTSHPTGDHTLYVGRVEAMSAGSDTELPLAFFRSAFAAIHPLPGHDVSPHLWAGGLDVWG